MKTLIALFALFVAPSIGQQAGTIFNTLTETKIVREDPTDSSSYSSSDQSSFVSSKKKTTGSDQVTSNSKSNLKGEDDTIPTGDGSIKESESVENSESSEENKESEKSEESENQEKEELVQENDEIQQENDEIEDLIVETLGEVEYYRYKKAELLQEYADKMDNLTRQIQAEEEEGSGTESVKSVSAESTETKEKESDEDDDDEDYSSLDISLIMIAVIGLGFLFLLLHSVRNIWLEFPAVEIHQGVYTILVDSTMLVLIWCITALLEYWDIFYIDIYTILVGLVIFTFFWLLLGLWVLFLINIQSEKWRILERRLTLPIEKTEEDTLYLIMRQLFITPTYIVPVTENELSPGFDFSVYLSKCLGQVVQNSLRITWVGYSLILLCLLIWKTVAEKSDSLEIMLLWVLPAIIFIVILILLWKLKRIFNRLVPNQLKSELNVSLAKHCTESEIRQAIGKPLYLQGKIPENVTCRFLCISFNPFKLTCAYLFLTRFPNRHELSFWFDSYGPTFISITIQAISILHTLWITAIILYYFPVFINHIENYGIYLVLVGIIVWVINGFYLLPKLLISLCLTSKIELMKERKIIEETVEHSKKQMIDKTVKIYRQLKMIYREVKGMDEGEEKGEILDTMKEIAQEVFYLFAEGNSIHATQLDDVLSLIGIRLREDELRLFAKECSPDKDNFVTIKGFLMAIERILDGFELNPTEVVRYVLLKYFKKVRKMNISDLTDFFDEWSWHFSDDILKDFLLESETLADERGQFRIQDFGNMVKIHVEALPK